MKANLGEVGSGLEESTNSGVATITPKKKKKPAFAEGFREFNGHNFRISVNEEGDGSKFCYHCQTKVSSKEEVADIMLFTDKYGQSLSPLLSFGMLLPMRDASSTIEMSFDKHPIAILEKEDCFQLTLSPNLPEHHVNSMINQILSLSELSESGFDIQEEFDLTIKGNKEKILTILNACCEPTSFFQGDTFIFPKRKAPTN